MGLFGKLVGRREPSEPRMIRGRDAARETRKLVAVSEKEGWNPIYSLVLNCTKCSSPTSIGVSESGYHFVSPDGSFSRGGFEQPLKCGNCSGTSFLLGVKPTTFRQALAEAVSELETTEQDPDAGFREDQAGQLVIDRSLKHASTFDALWDGICHAVDQGGDMNRQFHFDTVHGRYLEARIPAICHYNYKTRTTVGDGLPHLLRVLEQAQC